MNFPKEQIAEVKMTSERDGVKFKQYDVGWKYKVNVYDDGKVTYRDDSYNRYGNDKVERVFPNLVVEDMELKFRLEDFVEIIMERMEAGPYAKLLWSNNEDVKQEFIECMIDAYESGLNDEDRRKLLEGIKKEVHSKALDKLAYAMHKMEYDQSSLYNFFNERDGINDKLVLYDVRDSDGDVVRLQGSSNHPDYKIGGKSWDEAREFWRKEVLKQFPKGE